MSVEKLEKVMGSVSILLWLSRSVVSLDSVERMSGSMVVMLLCERSRVERELSRKEMEGGREEREHDRRIKSLSSKKRGKSGQISRRKEGSGELRESWEERRERRA